MSIRPQICAILLPLLLAGGRVPAAVPGLIEAHCTSCHDAAEKKGGIDLDSILGEDVSRSGRMMRAMMRRWRSW